MNFSVTITCIKYVNWIPLIYLHIFGSLSDSQFLQNNMNFWRLFKFRKFCAH